MLVLQVAVVTAQNRKASVTVLDQSLGSSPVVVLHETQIHFMSEWSSHIAGTRVHGSAEASGEDAVFLATSQLSTSPLVADGAFYHVGPNLG